MATYRIDVPATGGTLTAATYNTSCINNIIIDDSSGSDPYPIVSSTAATDGNVTISYNKNTQSNPREWTYNLSYRASENYCMHKLHLYQEGSGGEHAVISFRGHNCTTDYGTIEIASITLSDGSTIELQGVSEAVPGGGGDEHLGTVDVTGNIGKRITGGTVKFNGSIISDYTGLSGTISDGAEFTVTIGNCGGGPTKQVSIPYTVQFTNIEKGSVYVTLKVPNKIININVNAGGGTSTSGKTTGIAKFEVDSSWTEEQILNSIWFEIPNMVATLRHQSEQYDMRWNDTCLSCDIPDSQCSAFNPWPQICGPCKVCAGINYGIGIDNIFMMVTGGMCEL